MKEEYGGETASGQPVQSIRTGPASLATLSNDTIAKANNRVDFRDDHRWPAVTNTQIESLIPGEAFSPHRPECQRQVTDGTSCMCRKGQRLETRPAEQATIDLAHAVFEVDTVAGFVEVCHFAILMRRNAESACKLAYGVKHGLVFRSSYFATAKIRSRDLFYQRQHSDTDLLPTHGSDIDCRQIGDMAGRNGHDLAMMLKKEPRRPASLRGWTYRRRQG